MSQSIDIGGIFSSSSSTTYLGLCNYVFLVYLSSGCVATGRVKNSFRQFVYIGKGISPSCLFFFHIHSINGISLGSFQQSVDSQWSSTWLTYQATSTGKSHLGHSCWVFQDLLYFVANFSLRTAGMTSTFAKVLRGSGSLWWRFQYN